MPTKTFVDTNILAYTIDPDDPVRKQQASRAIEQLQPFGVISTQVLQEVFNTATRKFRMDPFFVKDFLKRVSAEFEVVTLKPALVLEAIDCSVADQISFWDALLFVAAESANCSQMLNEDLNAGQVVRRVKIVNPFKSVP